MGAERGRALGELTTPVFTQDSQGIPCGSDGKPSACSVGDLDLIPELGRSPREGNGYPLQYSCLENPMDRGDWWATVHGVKELDTTERLTLSLYTFIHGDLGPCTIWVVKVPWAPLYPAHVHCTSYLCSVSYHGALALCQAVLSAWDIHTSVPWLKR